MASLSEHINPYDPATQQAYQRACDAVAKVSNTLRYIGDIATKRDANIDQMQNIALEVIRAENVIANLHSEEIYFTADANRLSVNTIIARKMQSILLEEILGALDSYARSLSAMYLLNVNFSTEFIYALKSYISDRDSSRQLLATAMENELTTLTSIAMTQLKEDSMSPIEIKNLAWELPKRAVNELLYSPGHSTDIELPLYHPMFRDFLKPCFVKAISVRLTNGKEIHTLLRMRITHMGNVNVMDGAGK